MDCDIPVFPFESVPGYFPSIDSVFNPGVFLQRPFDKFESYIHFISLDESDDDDDICVIDDSFIFKIFGDEMKFYHSLKKQTQN